jgi:TrmH family RNA methyltransferase
LIDQARLAGAELVEMAPGPFGKVSYRDRPEGLLAVAKQFQTRLTDREVGPRPLVLVVEAIEKPGNLGTMLRTADATGVDLVIVTDPTTDIFNPNVVRASTGMLFEIPIAVSSGPEAIQWLRQRSIPIVATTPATSATHWDADLSNAAALVVGTEQYGLSDAWLHAADLKIRIPMEGRADSLNAAMAAGVVLYEALRQRVQSTDGD